MSSVLYSSFFVQALLFVCLAVVLLISVISLFIKPAKRTIRASLVEAETGHIIDIDKAETSLGRAKTCDIIISDISVSRFHAVLSKRTAGWMIFDTHSTHGIIHNGKIVDKKCMLNDGDSLIFGETEFIFYSTAVTTRQQIVPKINNKPNDDRPRYKKVSQQKSTKKQSSDNIRNKTKSTGSGNRTV